jgi:hypothetical protein
MLEVRGIADYEKYSHLSGKSRRGEGESAEFKQLLHAGEDESGSQAAPDIRIAAESERYSDNGREVATYDPVGRKTSFGAFVGRNLNVAI